MIDALVAKFADSVAAQSDAMKKGNVEGGNRHAADYCAAFNALRLHGDRGREALTALFMHERADVRITAAAFLLRYCHDRARAVLEVEAKGNDLLAFEAAQALERWQEGTWELDPE
jgi:hypothetical protein